MAASMKINGVNARSRRRPSVDSALAIQQAHDKPQKNFKSMGLSAGGTVARLLLTARRRSFASVLPEPLAADPPARTTKVGRALSRLPSDECVDSSDPPARTTKVEKPWSRLLSDASMDSSSDSQSVLPISASDADWQPNWSRRPSVVSVASSDDSQPVWSRRPSVDSADSQPVWSRRPSVDSAASTVDSVDSAALSSLGKLGFGGAGFVATAAQKLKRLSQESSDYACNARDGRVECPYCFSDLCQRSIVFLNDKSKPDSANCCHFLHADCCSAIQRRARKEGNHPECPKCKCEFGESHVVPVPHPFEDPDGWYHALDVHSSNRVPREIVLDALVASLPIEAKSIKGLVWKKGALRGKLTLQECKEILSKVEHDVSKMQRPRPPPPPDMEKTGEWFAHWDVGGAGILTQEEATRAILKCFPNHDLPLLREAIDLAWQENAQRRPEFAVTIGPEAFANQTSGIVGLVLTKYQALKYWKIWGSDDSHMENRIPRCLSCLSEAAF